MENPDTYQALFWGYSVIWLLIVAYIFVLRAKLNKIKLDNSKDQNARLES